MAAQNSMSTAWVTVTIQFRVAETTLQAELPVPQGPTRLRRLLPALQAVTDAVVGVGTDRSTAQGHAISCKRGCGACCRQLVPLAEPEAEQIHDLIAQLPPDTREKIQARFAAARTRLEQAGLLEKLLHPEHCSDSELRPLGLEYFHQHIACPFLEEESCSIYADRPLACREYLVTSDPQHCAHPSPETVRCVEMPAKLSTVLTQIGTDPTARFTRWVPLILAAERPATEENEIPAQTGPELLREVFTHLSKAAIPSNHSSPS